MALLDVGNSGKAGNVIKLSFNGNDLSSLCVVFPEVSGEAIEVRSEGIYVSLGDKKLFISFCETEPVFA